MNKKLRVACLHGYGTNAKFLERQMRSFMKAMRLELEFVFIDAPYQAPQQFVLDEKVLELLSGPPRSWIPFLSYRQRTRAFTESVIKSLDAVFENGDYDAILGFSQGCAMTHFILAMKELGLIKWKWLENIKFCILVCGITWAWKDLDLAVGKPLQVPSIHLLSEADFVYQKSILATALYASPLVIEHPFGHTFPRIGRIESKLIKEYIERVVDEKKTPMPLKMSSL